MMLCVHGSPLYQWDINRQLLIDSAELGSDFVIHCCYAEDSNAPVVEPKRVEDKVLVNIPNILLQRHGHLRVYVVVEGDTVYDATFYVMARPKPDDYVYTETEALSYVSLSKRMDELEKNGVSEEKIANAVGDYLKEHPVTETDPTVPAWAKASEKPKYTAKEVGALSQEELQNGVNLALKQAKDSGEFKGADGKDGKDGIDGKDGNDYVLTESDKQEIADMIDIPDIPESGGVSEEWEVIASLTLEEDLAIVRFTDLKLKKAFITVKAVGTDVNTTAPNGSIEINNKTILYTNVLSQKAGVTRWVSAYVESCKEAIRFVSEFSNNNTYQSVSTSIGYIDDNTPIQTITINTMGGAHANPLYRMGKDTEIKVYGVKL